MSRAVFTFLGLVGAVGACSPEPKARAPEPEPSAALDSREWLLTRMGGEAVGLEIWAHQAGTIIDFMAGCGFSVSMNSAQPLIREEAFLTRRCGPEDLATLNRLEAMVQAGAAVTPTNGSLIIRSSDGSEALFTKQPEPLVVD